MVFPLSGSCHWSVSAENNKHQNFLFLLPKQTSEQRTLFLSTVVLKSHSCDWTEEENSLRISRKIATERGLAVGHFSSLALERPCFLIPTRSCHLLLPDCSSEQDCHGFKGLNNGHQKTSATSALENKTVNFFSSNAFLVRLLHLIMITAVSLMLQCPSVCVTLAWFRHKWSCYLEKHMDVQRLKVWERGSPTRCCYFNCVSMQS